MLRNLFWLVPVVLAGCASVPDDRGWSQLRSLTAGRGQIVDESPGSHCDERVDKLLATPLNLRDAIAVALLCNPRLDSAYAQLGLGGSEVLKAGRPPNPLLSASYGISNTAGAVDRFGFGLSFDVLDLVLMPAKAKLAEADFARIRLETANQVLILAGEVRRHWFSYVAARQSAALADAAADTAEAAAAYAGSLFKAGNLSELELSLRQADAAATQLQRLQAQSLLADARQALQQAMGLHRDRPWETPATLPLPVANEDEVESLQRLARVQRLDLAAAVARVEVGERELAMTRGNGWLGSASLGGSHERGTDGVASTGPDLSFALPLFDQGQGRVMAAEARLDAAKADEVALRIEVETQITQACTHRDNAHAQLELLRTKLLPARARVTAQTLRQYNYMLAGSFELLLARQQQYDAFQRYVDALRDYWLARADLADASGGALPSDATIGASEFSVDSLLNPKSDGESP